MLLALLDKCDFAHTNKREHFSYMQQNRKQRSSFHKFEYGNSLNSVTVIEQTKSKTVLFVQTS